MKLDRGGVGYLLAFLSAAAGAARYNLAVWAHERTGFDYVAFLAYALAVGVVCSGVHVLVKNGTAGFVPLRGRWRHALLYGLLMGWGTLAHFLALDYLNETVVTSLSQTSILLTIGLAVWLLGERFTPLEWLAAIVICAGVFFFRPWSSTNAGGFVLLMSGLVSASLATIGAKRWVQGIPPQTLMFWRNVVALAMAGTYTLVFRERPAFTFWAVLACIATGIFGPYLHGLFFLQALQRIDASKAALMNRVQPVIVFLISWLALARLPTVNERWSSLVLVLGTILLALAAGRSRIRRS